jgi:hypothetical protein
MTTSPTCSDSSKYMTRYSISSDSLLLGVPFLHGSCTAACKVTPCQ